MWYRRWTYKKVHIGEMNLRESTQVFDCHMVNVTVGIIQWGGEIHNNRQPLCVFFAITSLCILYEFVHSTRWEIKILHWNWTIEHNICTTTPPPCHLAELVFLIIYILYVTHDSHEWENDVTKQIKGNQTKTGPTTDWPQHHFCQTPFWCIAPARPLPQGIQFLLQRNCQFWQCHSVTHTKANAMTSPE